MYTSWSRKMLIYFYVKLINKSSTLNQELFFFFIPMKIQIYSLGCFLKRLWKRGLSLSNKKRKKDELSRTNTTAILLPNTACATLTTFVRALDTATSISSAPLLSLGEPYLITMGSSSCCWLFRLFATAWIDRIHSSLTQMKTYIPP